MKTLRVSFAVLAVAVALLLAGGTTQAFHSGGVAECAGCHSIHFPKAGGTKLLVAQDPSSTCLTCHENKDDTGPNGYHVSTIGTMAGTALPLQRTPGGDFAWVKKTYTYSYGGNTYTEQGSTHGHNVIAADFGYLADTEVTTAPGGSFPAAQLSCTSCHDPHGQYSPAVQRHDLEERRPDHGQRLVQRSHERAVGYRRGWRLPPARRCRLHQGRRDVPRRARREGAEHLQPDRGDQPGEVAYGNATAGGHVSWGHWCATCHPDMHSDGHYVHPVDQGMSGTTIDNYNMLREVGRPDGRSRRPRSRRWCPS